MGPGAQPAHRGGIGAVREPNASAPPGQGLPGRGAGGAVGFGERALRHFLFLERPEGMELEDAEGFVPTGPALPIMSKHDIIPWGQEFATVSHLYRSIEAGLENLSTHLGEDMLFIGPPGAQATSEWFGWPDLVAITGLDAARAVITRIVEQGEGAQGSPSGTASDTRAITGATRRRRQPRRAGPLIGPSPVPVRGVVRAHVEGHASLSPRNDVACGCESDLGNRLSDPIHVGGKPTVNTPRTRPNRFPRGQAVLPPRTAAGAGRRRTPLLASPAAADRRGGSSCLRAWTTPRANGSRGTRTRPRTCRRRWPTPPGGRWC
ncbi:MAG: ferritin-like domain-containing protein [Acidimicrobiales bacterium]